MSQRGTGCPWCGGLITLKAATSYDSSARWAGSEAATLRQTHPPRQSGVGDELKKAIITGVLPGTLLAIPYAMASMPKPFAAWVIASLALSSAAWLLGQQPAAVIENEVKTSKSASKRHKPTITLQIEGQADDGGDLMARLDLDCDEASLRALASAWHTGESYAEAAMSGNGRPFSRGEYKKTVNQLMRRGLARWVSERAHSQGWEPTAKGEAVLRGLAACPTAPK